MGFPRFPRPPDWLIYLTVVAGLVLAAILIKSPADAPPPPPPMPVGGAQALAAASPFDPAVVVRTPTRPGQGAGTAFSIADGGVWLTARHVVEGCRSLVIIIEPGAGVSAQARIDPRAETAVLMTRGGAPALPLAPEAELKRGLTAFHPGFPQGQAGEAASRLVGRERLYPRGRGGGAEPVLAWAEIGRTEGLSPSLEGLSGAPALDAAGRVVGVTIAQAPRRDRLYTTTPEAVAAALRFAGVRSAASPGEAITTDNYGRIADDLRRDLRVAQVVCLGS
jgi:S1-C subfamily serine protease